MSNSKQISELLTELDIEIAFVKDLKRLQKKTTINKLNTHIRSYENEVSRMHFILKSKTANNLSFQEIEVLEFQLKQTLLTISLLNMKLNKLILKN